MYKVFVLLSLCSAFPSIAQQQAILCTSKQKPHVCPADTANGVLLIHEESNHLCRQGKTWRHDDVGVHVNGGCSGTFLVNPKRGLYLGGTGYQTFGTGDDAFHTNGSPTPGASDAASGASKPLRMIPK